MGKSKKILLKELCPWTVRENSFEGGGGGASGTVAYAAPYGTPAGGNYSQSPDKFSSSDKTVNHFNNQESSSLAVPKMPDRLDRRSSSGAAISPGAISDKRGFENPQAGKKPNHIVPFGPADDSEEIVDDNPERANAPEDELGGEPSPGAKADQEKSDTPLNPDNAYDDDVNTLFKKKETPSPDEIMSALQYELGNMVKKDKAIAKRIILKNLKENPHHYSQLNMLNIDDEKMKVDESQISRTKSVLDQMIAERQARVTPVPPYVKDILNGLHKKRHGLDINANKLD
jgi:hypothetical protein